MTKKQDIIVYHSHIKLMCLADAATTIVTATIIIDNIFYYYYY